MQRIREISNNIEANDRGLQVILRLMCNVIIGLKRQIILKRLCIEPMVLWNVFTLQTIV